MSRTLPVTHAFVFAAITIALCQAGCAVGNDSDSDPGELPPDEDLAVVQQAAVSCDQWIDTGYVSGSSFPITLVTVDDRPVEIDTANAYVVMQDAAAADGVQVRIVSGFRTWDEQDYLRNCYECCCCNSCNLAAEPGYSNHQSGHALDLNTSASGVLTWLNNHGEAFGFKRTVASETWHWEWWGGGPGGGPCDSSDGNTCTIGSGETGACMDTGACAELGGTHVSTAGFCPGPSNIQCCTGSTPCTVTTTGATGECLNTSACEALGPGYVATAGYCPGPSYYQCCTGPAPEEDAGVPEEDAGVVEQDAAPPEQDGSTPDEDAGVDQDGDTPDEDAGAVDEDAGADAEGGKSLSSWDWDESGSGCRMTAGQGAANARWSTVLTMLLGLLGVSRIRRR